METCAFRQHNPRFVQRTGSGIKQNKQMKANGFHFTPLSWRQCALLRVGLPPNVDRNCHRDKTISPRISGVI
ncbi:transcriptional regulator [Siccibacter turicensis]|uniref:Transcriptional regulator n=1 Tax=Siccibacter turicensis TaxID=357233 RepID=A0A2P8VS68_9ENTR|nr:transcriptional regulator [Siccibacter turicensis]